MAGEFFIELTLLFLIATLVTGIMKVLKQPLIIGYIITGIIVGPFFLNIVSSIDLISTFAHIGIAFLLFMVGLNLNPSMIKDVGKVSLVTGLGQVIFTSVIGFFIASLFGFTVTQSIYIAIALTFSSTIIIMKLLSDRNDLESLYGRIAIGFLIVQDIIAILMLVVLSSLSTGSSAVEIVLFSFLKGGGLILAIFLFSKYVLPYATKAIAKSPEYLLLFSITWCFVVAGLFDFLNFSIEAGALLAGVALSMSPYHHEISSKMKTLRDFFILLFFILLGSQMVFSNISEYIVPVLVLSFFVLIGNPLIVLVLMGLLGYAKRTSFMAGLTVAQISEFSLVLIALGVSSNILTQDILSFVTFIGLVTIAGSTYMIMYADKIYPFLSPYLSLFERKGKKKDDGNKKGASSYQAVLFGYNRIGFDVLESFKKMKKKCLVVDHNPETISTLTKRRYSSLYGDANNLELYEDINFKNAKIVVSTISSVETNVLLISQVRISNPKAILIVISHQIDDALELYKQGATYVIMPHFLGGKHVASILEKNKLNTSRFTKERKTHLSHLRKRKEDGHEHPLHEKRQR